MAVFTAEEAEACTITACSKEKKNGTHQRWVFNVTDDNDLSYSWVDEKLASSATIAQIKDAIQAYLTGIEKLPVPDAWTAELKSTVIGKTVGLI